MKPIRVLFGRIYNSKLLNSLLLTATLALTAQTAWADYQPPREQKAPTKSSGMVARGSCQANSSGSLTALAPQHHVGQTVSTHPTFAWFVPDSQVYPLVFKLFKYEPNGDRQLVWETDLPSQPGIMSLTLPSEQPELSVGQRYAWKVVMLCNPNRPSNSLVAGAELDVVESTAIKERETTAEPGAIANLYAVAGIWYDALATALDAKPERFDLTLLENLAKMEAAKESEKLRQIIKIEQQQKISYIY